MKNNVSKSSASTASSTRTAVAIPPTLEIPEQAPMSALDLLMSSYERGLLPAVGPIPPRPQTWTRPRQTLTRERLVDVISQALDILDEDGAAAF